MEDKIINIFDKKGKSDFTNFEYVKLNRDTNGMKFNEEKLLEYAHSCRYIVRVMRDIEGDICMYNFNVPSEKLSAFLSSFDQNSSLGKIIEVEKFIPEELA